MTMTSINFDISCFMGKQRAGKTLSMVAKGYNVLLEIKEEIFNLEHKKKHSEAELKRLEIFRKMKLMSNLNLNKKIFGDYLHLTSANLLKMYEEKIPIQYYIILLDDFFKSVDNRKSMSKENISYSYFFTEIGKGKNILLYVSHFKSIVERRLKLHTENFIVCRKGAIQKIKHRGKIINFFMEFGDYYSLQNTEKKIYIQQSHYRNELDLKNDFNEKMSLKSISYLEASKYYKMYDTEEIV